MAMHNLSHPGEFIIQVYLGPNNLSGRELAGKLGVAASTLNRILTGTSRLSPDMALRLSKTDALFRLLLLIRVCIIYENLHIPCRRSYAHQHRDRQ